jgi:streptogramin lyase
MEIMRQIMMKFEIKKFGVYGLALAMVGAVSCASAAAQNYTFTEWKTPSVSSQPLHIAVASNTQFYFTESAKNRIGGVNLATSQNGGNPVTEWPLLAGSMPHSIVLDALENLAFCAYGGNYVGVLTPTLAPKPPNSPFTYYLLPTPASGPIHLDTELDAVGAPEYFFSEALGNRIGLLDPTTETFTEWTIPTPSSTPRGVSIGAGTQVFFAELATHKIGMLDTSTNIITEWTIPSVRQVEHLHFVNGQIYFGDLATSVVGILNPNATTNNVTEWTVPTPSADIPDVFVVGTTFYFSERAVGKIGFLDPSQQAGTLKTAKQTQTVATPVINPATPVSTTLLSHKTTYVTPTVTNVTGVPNGGFMEWTIPSLSPGPLGILGEGASNPIFFAEYFGASVGMLAPQNTNSPNLTSNGYVAHSEQQGTSAK